jgi:hypothetical protein
MRTTSLAVLAASAVAALGLWATGALASAASTAGVTLCADKGGGLTYSVAGTCPGKTTAIVVAANADLQGLEARISTLEGQVTALQSLLSGVSRTTFNGADTLQFSGMNVQVVNGTGSTSSTLNGLGNLIVGYDAGTSLTTSGSHNIIVGEGNSFSSYGGLAVGADNLISGAYASVSGAGNTGSGVDSSVSGGEANTAKAEFSSVSGGELNTASGFEFSTILGGYHNTANGNWASVSGGEFNTASGFYSSILGGSGVTVTTSDGTSP